MKNKSAYRIKATNIYQQRIFNFLHLFLSSSIVFFEFNLQLYIVHVMQFQIPDAMKKSLVRQIFFFVRENGGEQWRTRRTKDEFKIQTRNHVNLQSWQFLCARNKKENKKKTMRNHQIGACIDFLELLSLILPLFEWIEYLPCRTVENSVSDERLCMKNDCWRILLLRFFLQYWDFCWVVMKNRFHACYAFVEFIVFVEEFSYFWFFPSLYSEKNEWRMKKWIIQIDAWCCVI